MIVKFLKNERELASRFYESFAPSVGDEVTVEGDSYNVVSRRLDLDHNEVFINMEEKV